MKLQVKYDINIVCKAILKEHLDKVGISYESVTLGEIITDDRISTDQIHALNENLKTYGIEIVDDQKSDLIQKIKDVIIELVYMDEDMPQVKTSAYIADKLNYSYSYIAALFSEVTYTSIENYIILQKIERAKQLILANDLTLTEIAYRLNYSSVAHLSVQFKKTTGLTPSFFQSIIKKRRINQII